MTGGLLSALGRAFVALATLGVSVDHAAEPVTIDVRFKLVELDSKPLSGHSVRLVVGSEPGWQTPEAGVRFVTDANGEITSAQTQSLTNDCARCRRTLRAVC